MKNDKNQPQLFIYSLLLPILWLSTGFIAGYLIPGQRIGLAGLIFITVVGLSLICWYFSKTFSRHLTKHEKWRLIFYTTFLALLTETSVIWNLSQINGTPEMPLAGWILMIFTYIVYYAFMMWFGVQVIGKRVIDYVITPTGNAEV